MKKQFLAVSGYIDWQHPAVLAKVRELAGELTAQVEIANRRE